VLLNKGVLVMKAYALAILGLLSPSSPAGNNAQGWSWQNPLPMIGMGCRRGLT